MLNRSLLRRLRWSFMGVVQHRRDAPNLGGRTHPLIGHESESQWRMAQPMRHELLQIQVLHSQTAQLV
jgi:hypothetical protein